jgi:hypothetical protein
VKPRKIPLEPEDFVEHIGLVQLHAVKHSSRTYYVTIEPTTIHAYGLLPGDILKISIIEARKHRERGEQ